jgi:hypothetical protein
MDAADNDPKTRTGSGTRITDRLAAVAFATSSRWREKRNARASHEQRTNPATIEPGVALLASQTKGLSASTVRTPWQHVRRVTLEGAPGGPVVDRLSAPRTRARCES